MNLQISEANSQMLKLLDPKGKADQFPFSMAFAISDKKAMEKGQGMRR